MNSKRAAIGVIALLQGIAGDVMAANGGEAAYPHMAPIAQYLSPSQAAEIELARSAAPSAISDEARVLTLGAKGYEVAVKGKNPFVCIVERPWANNFDSPDFWNPKVRAPQCFNAAAARSVLPTYLRRTEWVLSGVSKREMLKRTKAALAAKEIHAPEVGSMAYMLSKASYLGDDVGGHWYPHVMLFLPRTAANDWGANLDGSPIFADSSALEPLTVFFVPVSRWSDGSTAEMSERH